MSDICKIFGNARFAFRSDTLANWEAWERKNKDNILLSGEIAVVTDGTETQKVKIGDGKTPWSKLPWWMGPKGDKGDTADLPSAAPSISNTISGGEKSLTVNDVSPIAHKCSLRLTSDIIYRDFNLVTLYVNGKSYTPNPDGSVTDIASVSPTMEITTDNEDVNICDFTYCVDTKKYIDNVEVDLTNYVQKTDSEWLGAASKTYVDNGLNNKPGKTFLVTGAKGVGEIFNNYESNTANYRAHAEGSVTTALGEYSHTEGYKTETKGSFAHAEGNETKAHGSSSHSEGNWTKASGKYSHSEGNNTVASGECSHAEGHHTQAYGHASHTAGMFTIASELCEAQYVTGKYNKVNKNAIFIVGNGVGIADSERSNAFEVFLDGHAEVQTMGENPNGYTVATKRYVDNELAKVEALKNPIMDYITYEIGEYVSGNMAVAITGCNPSISGDYEIPKRIEGYPVTSIAPNAFSSCTSLTSITIPDSVISIGSYAFYNCRSLASISIPDSVVDIGNRAFLYCTMLTDVYYKGTQEQWEQIYIDSANVILTDATRHYNQAPATKAYVDDAIAQLKAELLAMLQQ